MDEVSNKTLAILIALVIVVSVVGTWLVLTQEKTDLSWMPHGDSASGKVKLGVGNIQLGQKTDTGSGRVSLVVLQ